MILNWIIVFAIISAGFLFIRLSHTEKKIKLIVVSVVLIFLYISANSLLTENNIKLDSIEGYSKAVSIYLGWLVSTGKTVFSVSGDAVKFAGNVIKGNLTLTK